MGNSERVATVADQNLSRAVRLAVRRELKHLEDVLDPDEELVSLAQGDYEDRQDIVALTDRRVIFFERGVVRARQEDFPLSKISSVQTERSMMTGKLVIHGEQREHPQDHAQGARAGDRRLHPQCDLGGRRARMRDGEIHLGSVELAERAKQIREDMAG